MNLLAWFEKNALIVHLIAFSLMVLPCIPLYWAAAKDAAGWIYFLIALVILGNLLEVALKKG